MELKNIYLFEDRLDVINTKIKEMCKVICIPNRAWNRYIRPEPGLRHFESYDELCGQNDNTSPLSLFVK